MILGVDLDGCLADFNSSYIARIVDLHGDRLVGPMGTPFSQMLPQHASWYPDCWDYPEAAGYTDTQMSAVWKSIKKDPLFWRSLHAFPGTRAACEALERVAAEGHNVYFITSRPGATAKAQSEWWLKGYGLSCPTVIVSPDKAAFTMLLKLDAYIDDRLLFVNDVMHSVREAGLLTRVYLQEQPWNRRPLMDLDPEKVPPVTAWDDYRDPAVRPVLGVVEMLMQEGLV